MIGGVASGISAVKNGRDFWTGEKVKVYKFNVYNNFGRTNGECVYRSLEESGKSLGSDMPFEDWLAIGDNKLGVPANKEVK